MNPYDQMLQQMISGPGGMYGAVGLDEIVGLEEIIGEDNANKLRSLAQLRAAGGVGVQPVVRDKNRTQPAPWTAQAVNASASSTITIQPQRLIQIQSIMIPSYLGQLFNLTDVRVGQQTQFITTGGIPVQLLSEVADGERSRMKFDSADVGNTVALDVTNLDTVNAQTFRGMLVAKAVYG